MPSAFAEPTVAELLQAFEDGVRAQKDRYVDVREGALYEHWSGVAAILWSREARRDTDLWRAVYLDSAEGKDLTNLLQDRYDFEREEDDYGTGTALLKRTSTAAGAGTVWEGTRILVHGDAQLPKIYVVTEDKDVGATDTTATISIRADRVGPGTAIAVIAGSPLARVDDPIWDTAWTVDTLTCTDGASFEPAPQARARFRETRKAARAGFVDAIVTACKAVGAANALLFPSNYAGEAYDYGLNVAYVGDENFTATDALVRAVKIELENWRVLGDNLQILPMARANLVVDADVNLWDTPGRVNQAEVRALLKGAIKGYFDGRTAGFSYDRDAMSGAMLKASPAAQFVTFNAPSSDVQLMTTIGGLPNFPATLTRYQVRDDDITLTLLPPV